MPARYDAYDLCCVRMVRCLPASAAAEGYKRKCSTSEDVSHCSMLAVDTSDHLAQGSDAFLFSLARKLRRAKLRTLRKSHFTPLRKITQTMESQDSDVEPDGAVDVNCDLSMSISSDTEAESVAVKSQVARPTVIRSSDAPSATITKSVKDRLGPRICTDQNAGKITHSAVAASGSDEARLVIDTDAGSAEASKTEAWSQPAPYPHCNKLCARKKDLTRHIKSYCKVLKAKNDAIQASALDPTKGRIPTRPTPVAAPVSKKTRISSPTLLSIQTLRKTLPSATVARAPVGEAGTIASTSSAVSTAETHGCMVDYYAVANFVMAQNNVPQALAIQNVVDAIEGLSLPEATAIVKSVRAGITVCGTQLMADCAETTDNGLRKQCVARAKSWLEHWTL